MIYDDTNHTSRIIQAFDYDKEPCCYNCVKWDCPSELGQRDPFRDGHCKGRLAKVNPERIVRKYDIGMRKEVRLETHRTSLCEMYEPKGSEFSVPFADNDVFMIYECEDTTVTWSCWNGSFRKCLRAYKFVSIEHIVDVIPSVADAEGCTTVYANGINDRILAEFEKTQRVIVVKEAVAHDLEFAKTLRGSERKT